MWIFRQLGGLVERAIYSSLGHAEAFKSLENLDECSHLHTCEFIYQHFLNPTTKGKSNLFFWPFEGGIQRRRESKLGKRPTNMRFPDRPLFLHKWTLSKREKEEGEEWRKESAERLQKRKRKGGKGGAAELAHMLQGTCKSDWITLWKKD